MYISKEKLEERRNEPANEQYEQEDKFISEKNRVMDRIIRDSTRNIKYYEDKLTFYSNISNEDFLRHLHIEGKTLGVHKMDRYGSFLRYVSKAEQEDLFLYDVIEEIKKKKFVDWGIHSILNDGDLDKINKLTSNHRKTLIKYPELVRKIGEAKSLLVKEYRLIAKIRDILNSKPNTIKELRKPNTAPPSKTKAVDTPLIGGKNKTRRQKKMKGKQSKNKTKNNASKKFYLHT